MVIYLIRHAQTLHNKKGKVFSGVSDVLLSDEGKEEARKCRNLPFIQNIEKIYISPLIRTKQTADIIFGEEIEKTVITELSEMDFGDYEGRILDEENIDDEVFVKWMNDPENLTFPHGDNFSGHALEAFSAFKKIAENEKADTIAVVSHRTTIRLILTQLSGNRLNTFREIECDNCSFSKIIFENDEYKIEKINIRA